MEAYLAGLESFDGDLSRYASVASRSSSPGRHRGRSPPRRDRDGGGARAPRGGRRWPRPRWPTGIRPRSGARWETLIARGQRVQRPLWASTSTKNPAYPADGLRRPADRPRHGEHDARGDHRGLHDHGTTARTVDDDIVGADPVEALSEVGVALDDVGQSARGGGRRRLRKAFDELIGPRRQGRRARVAEPCARRPPSASTTLSGEFAGGLIGRSSRGARTWLLVEGQAERRPAGGGAAGRRSRDAARPGEGRRLWGDERCVPHGGERRTTPSPATLVEPVGAVGANIRRSGMKVADPYQLPQTSRVASASTTLASGHRGHIASPFPGPPGWTLIPSLSVRIEAPTGRTGTRG